MGVISLLISDFFVWVLFGVLLNLWWVVLGLGLMFSIVIFYGENGFVFCGLKFDGLYFVICYGLNVVVIYGIFFYFLFVGLIVGDGFVCGLLMDFN